jgi:hypothetical protein
VTGVRVPDQAPSLATASEAIDTSHHLMPHLDRSF